MRETSLEAYERYYRSGKLGKQETIVYNAFRQFPFSTDKEISELTGIEINAITGRRNKLVELGILFEGPKRKCKETSYVVLTWSNECKELPKKTCLSEAKFKNLIKSLDDCNEFQIKRLKEIILRK